MTRPLAIIVACAIALPALAQDAGQDWDMLRDQRKKLTMAYTQFDNGLGIAVRCIDESYEAVITGLPPVPARSERRELRVAFGDDELHTQHWNVAVNDTIAVSDLPAMFARSLRGGGRLRVMVPGGAEGGRNLLYDLTLPASPTSIDETLTVCGRPLVDPRDAELAALPEAGLPPGLTWARAPAPDFPVDSPYARGFAAVMCMVNPDGSLRDCTVESEHPQEAGFGAAALRGTRRARVHNADSPSAPVPGGRVVYRSTFIMEGHETRDDQRRSRERRERDRQGEGR